MRRVNFNYTDSLLLKRAPRLKFETYPLVRAIFECPDPQSTFSFIKCGVTSHPKFVMILLSKEIKFVLEQDRVTGGGED